MGNEYSTKLDPPPSITTSIELNLLIQGYSRNFIDYVPTALIQIIILFYYGKHYPSDSNVFGIGYNINGCLSIPKKGPYQTIRKITKTSINQARNIFRTQSSIYIWCYNNSLYFSGYDTYYKLNNIISNICYISIQ